MESALTFRICCYSVISPVQFIVQVNAQVLLDTPPMRRRGLLDKCQLDGKGEIEAAVVIGLRSNAGPCLATFSLTCKEVKVHIWLNTNNVSDRTEHYLNIQQELLLNLTQVVLEPKPNHTMSL